MAKLPLLLGLLVVACAAGGAYRALPAAERSAFEACSSFVEQRACGQHRDSVVRQFCLSDVAEKYAALPSTESRRSFLSESGCPSSLVANTR